MIDFAAHAGKPCLLDAGGRIHSYADIDARVDAYARELNHGRGLLLLGCSTSVECVVAYLGALRAGCPVMFADDTRDDQIERLAVTFRPRYVQRAASLKPTILDDAETDIHADLAILLSTSGSTGAAKAVRLSHENIASNARSIAEYLEIADIDRAALILPLHYSYGLSVLNSHLAAGGSVWLTDASVTDRDFWDRFVENGCTSFPGVPHVYQLMERDGFSSDRVPGLRHATQAGGHLSRDLVTKFATMARRDGWRFYVMYGQTEASPRMSYVPPEQVLEHPDCIGVAIPGGSFRLDGDAADPEGTGELVYSGPNVMMGYATGSADLRLGKETEELRTGDLAERNAAGLFRIVGRRSRFIKPFGLRISLDEVERWLAGRGIVAAAVGDDGLLGVYVAGECDARALEHDLAIWLKLPPSSIRVTAIDALPRAASGKLDYPAVKRLFEAARSSGATAKPPEADVASLFASFFDRRERTDADSFTTLGGDSLKFIQFSIELEALLGELPADWERLSIGELQALVAARRIDVEPRRPLLRPMDTRTALRAYAIICVVTHHFGLWRWTPNGSTLLLILAGASFGQFQLPEVLRSGRMTVIRQSVVRILIPTVLWIGLIQALHRQMFVPGLLLVGNYLPPHTGVDAWFLDVYIQIFIGAALILSIPAWRAALERYPVLSSAIAAGATFALAIVMPHVWDTAPLFDRVPHLLVWLVAWGVLVTQIRSRAVMVGALLVFCVANAITAESASMFVNLMLGSVILAFVRTIPLPGLVRRGLAEIAGASLFIYLTHYQIAEAVRIVLHVSSPAVLVVVALTGGIMVSRGYAWGERRVTHIHGSLPSLRRLNSGRAGRQAPKL